MLQNDTVIQSAPKIKVAPPKKKKAAAKPDTFALKTDSLIQKDSLLKADSLHKADSLKTLTNKIPTGFEGRTIPSTIYSASWFFPAIVILFFLLIVSLNKSFGSFMDSVKNFFKLKENSLAGSSMNVLEYKSYSTLFFLGVFSLLAFVIFDNGVITNFFVFLKFFGVTVCFYILKILIIEFIGHVFFDVRRIRMYKNVYSDLCMQLAVLFFILMVFGIYKPISIQVPFTEIYCILLVIFHILLLIKLFQIFYSKLIDTFYIFLYLCTLEILPLIGLFLAYNFLI